MSYKNKINRVLGITLMTFFISSGASYAANVDDTVVNDYDCSLPELREYVSKKTEYFVNSPTALTTWEEFKRQDMIEGAGTGNVPKDGAEIGKDGANEPEECNYFWGDLEDWDTEMKKQEEEAGGKYDDLINIIGGIMKGDMKGFYEKSKELMKKRAEEMYAEVKKGVCKRLSSENVKREVYRSADKYFSRNTIGGYNPVDVIDGNFNGFVNDVLGDSYGSNGKLLNVFDKDLDSRRERFINNEVERQYESIKDR